MTVKLCTSQKVSGEPAVWQGMDGSTLEKWGWEGGRGMRDSRESIAAGGDAGRFFLEINHPVKKKIGIASWTKRKGVRR